MPDPRPGESRDDFLDRCIPQVIEEGREPDQAVAMCVSYYEGYKDKAFDIKDDDRIEYWKAFDRRRESFDAKYTRVFSKAIRKQLEIYEDAETLSDLKADISTEPIKQAYFDLYSEVGDTFARLTWQGFKRLHYYEMKQETPVWVDRMIAIARGEASGRIVGVSETIKKAVNAIILLGIEEGLSVQQIKRLIIGSTDLPPLNGTLEQRALRIARTEIAYASNRGSLEGALSSQVEFDKQWLSLPEFTGTRDGHINADGQTVNKNAPFMVANDQGRLEPLMVPGDPAGSASNVINCRCTQTYITPKGEI